MKNLIQYIGIIILILFSFFYTEKAVSTIKKQDPLMEEIESLKNEYDINAEDAKILENKIIPGIKGCEVDIDKSYYNLKRFGKFNSGLLTYKISNPKISIENNYDKYIISGNKSKKSVTLIFKVRSGMNINNIINILNNKKIKATFFIEGKFIEENIGLIQDLINNNHEVLNYGYNNGYDKDLLIWNNNLIEMLNYNNPKFCYLEKEDINTINLCSQNKMKTVIPNLIIKNNPLLEVKKSVSYGSLISFDITDSVTNELNLIINYLKNKGYNIDILSHHVEESLNKNCKNVRLGD